MGNRPAEPSQKDLSNERYTLTQRQRKVLSLKANGKTNEQIATALGITENTVETHVSRAYNKLEDQMKEIENYAPPKLLLQHADTLEKKLLEAGYDVELPD